MTAASDVAAQLRALGHPARAKRERQYLKSELDHLGVSVPAVRKVAVGVHRQLNPSHDQLVALVTALWRQPVHELRLAAVELLTLGTAALSIDDRELLETLLRRAHTWALVDPLAVQVVGVLAKRDAAGWDPVLRRWAVDPDHWVRRTALLAHLHALRGTGADVPVVFARFGELADLLLEEREFFIRKAIGWVLRETARKHPELVATWLEPRAARAAGLTVREAVKHLPDEARARILGARDARRE